MIQYKNYSIKFIYSKSMRISEAAQVVVEKVIGIVVYRTSIKFVYQKSLRISEEFTLYKKSMNSSQQERTDHILQLGLAHHVCKGFSMT